jgi:hypothetical protein
MDKRSSLGMSMHHPKKYPRSTSVKAWGCPRGTPSSSTKIGHLSIHYIFIASCTMHFFGASVVFVFSISLVYFAAING